MIIESTSPYKLHSQRQVSDCVDQCATPSHVLLGAGERKQPPSLSRSFPKSPSWVRGWLWAGPSRPGLNPLIRAGGVEGMGKLLEIVKIFSSSHDKIEHQNEVRQILHVSKDVAQFSRVTRDR